MNRGVVVVDYGIGNIHSVRKALVHVGAEVRLSSDSRDLLMAERVVLPGVGAFPDGMRGLSERALDGPLREYAASGRPLLGICLGMQLLFSESEEFGLHRGLGIVPGRVVAIPPEPPLKIPHIGWNRVFPAQDRCWMGTPLEPLAPGTMVYFVHSYSAVPDDATHRLADADYGRTRVCAAVLKDNVWGCQFHPEKSGEVGLGILRRFVGAEGGLDR